MEKNNKKTWEELIGKLEKANAKTKRDFDKHQKKTFAIIKEIKEFQKKSKK